MHHPDTQLFIWRRVIRQKLDLGQYKELLFFRLTVYMGQAGNSLCRDPGNESPYNFSMSIM